MVGKDELGKSIVKTAYGASAEELFAKLDKLKEAHRHNPTGVGGDDGGERSTGTPLDPASTHQMHQDAPGSCICLEAACSCEMLQRRA